jgi:hypothetical protein
MKPNRELSMPADWASLVTELQVWASMGEKPSFWLRDDDAIEPSAALDRLLSLCHLYRVPIALAVIPEPSGSELADHLKDSDLINVAVHGWRHANHAGLGEKKQELGKHRPIAEILSELERGFTKLKSLHGERFLPMLVPPWNRMDGALLEYLPAIGFRLVSSYGNALADYANRELAIVNTQVDIIDWSSRRGRDHGALVGLLVKQLRDSRETDRHPVGILAHHRDHDETALRFLDQLFAVTAGADAGRWLAGGSLMITR